METLERYSALAGRVGYFSIVDDEIELVTNPSEANCTVTVTPNDLTLDVRLSARDAYQQEQWASAEEVVTTAMQWLWGLQVLHLNPHDYGLELAQIPWNIEGSFKGDLLPVGQESGWLKGETLPVAWIAPGADLDNPLTPILQPRVNATHDDVEWMVLQAAVDADWADLEEGSDGVMTFAWDDAEGMKVAAELLCTSEINEINALRALSDDGQWDRYRQQGEARGKQGEARKEIARIYDLLAERSQRTPESLSKKVSQEWYYPNARRYDPAKPLGVALIPPKPTNVSRDDYVYTRHTKRRIAAVWDHSSWPRPDVSSDDTDMMADLAATCRSVDPQLTLVRARAKKWRPGDDRVYLTRAPRLLADLFKVVDPYELKHQTYALAHRLDDAIQKGTGGDVTVEMWVDGAWKPVR
jgi:hypothetical protein